MKKIIYRRSIVIHRLILNSFALQLFPADSRIYSLLLHKSYFPSCGAIEIGSSHLSHWQNSLASIEGKGKSTQTGIPCENSFLKKIWAIINFTRIISYSQICISWAPCHLLCNVSPRSTLDYCRVRPIEDFITFRSLGLMKIIALADLNLPFSISLQTRQSTS